MSTNIVTQGDEPSETDWELISLDRVVARLLERQLQAVYVTTFAEPPFSRTTESLDAYFQQMFPRYRRAAGFRGVAARDATGAVVGMAYGYQSRPGHWWHNQVARALAPPQRAQWLADAFELAELAVCPAWQGRGIGGALHDALLEGLPHRCALLSTLDAAAVARHLYQRRGWQTLVESYRFEPGGRPYRILGRWLSA